jgi:hypothetical protein
MKQFNPAIISIVACDAFTSTLPPSEAIDSGLAIFTKNCSLLIIKPFSAQHVLCFSLANTFRKSSPDPVKEGISK